MVTTNKPLSNGVRVLRALNNPFRESLMNLLRKKGEATVTDLYTSMRTEQSVMSQHLAILRAERIVIRRREGKQLFYSIDDQRVNEIITLCEQLSK